MTEVPRIDNSGFVKDEYSDDARLRARSAFWAPRTGPQPQDVALERVLELHPATALEVGCGQGAFAFAMQKAGIQVTAVDQSEHIVALTAKRGVRAEQADIQNLPFDSDVFDVVVAAYMLYHVPSLSRALSEVRRVLKAGGALVAVTNSVRKIHEMWDLVGRDRDEGDEAFNSENGGQKLAEHFESVKKVDVEGRFTVTEDAIRDYICATRFSALAKNVPHLPDGLSVTAAGSVFIATKPL